jgi:hypothetical protein
MSAPDTPRLAALCLLLAAPPAHAQSPVSSLASDEDVVLFETAAWRDQTADHWHVPVHGWVHEPEDSRFRKAAIEKLLDHGFGITVSPATRSNFDRRVNALLADNERGERIVIDLGGERYPLAESEPNGHFRDIVEVDAAHAGVLAADGLLRYRAVLRPGDTRSFTGSARLVDGVGLSVISDIDDTIKITNVRDRREMLERSLLRDFEAVPGMAALYAAWAERGVAFHFVSSSPWHLYPFLAEFTRRAGFPWATFSLKHVRVKDKTLLDLFKPGTETKPVQIEPLLERFSDRRFILIGDNGEQDPEVYAQLLARHPQQVVRVYIRNVAGESAGDVRYRRLFAGVDPATWRLFDDPATLELPAR